MTSSIIWLCCVAGCAWTGTRSNCDSHIRQTGHAVCPKAVTFVHDCGMVLNVGSGWCRGCQQYIKKGVEA